MMSAALFVSIVLLGICLVLAFLRLLWGPTSMDRLLAFDAISVSAVALTAVLAMVWSEPHFLEIILVFSILGFLSTTTVVLYLSRTHTPVRDPSPTSENRKGKTLPNQERGSLS